MISAFRAVFGGLFHTTRHFGRKNYFNKVVNVLHQNNFLTNLFHATRHSEQRKESLNEILRLKPQDDVYHPTPSTFDKNRRAAFTLAEVLITLGIIGVVAALTIPTLVKNYRIKVLKTRYTQTYAILSEATIKTRMELGENLYENCFINNSINSVFSRKFEETFLKNCNYIQKSTEDYTITNYTGTQSYSTTEQGDSDYPAPLYMLKNGSSVDIRVNGSTIRIFADTNGPKSGPNRLGYDIFRFHLKNDLLAPVKMYKKYTSEEELEDVLYPFVDGYPCTKDSPQILNGTGCSWYAHHDMNPDDETKGYWESLKF